MNDIATPVSSRGKWMALAAALLGWMFDGLEMGLFPLVARPALQDLLGHAEISDAEIGRWMAVVTSAFLIGAATGGVLFGWLGDRIGRVRAMMLSVLTYALFSGACGFATEAWQIAGLRFISALGMGGEWSLGVALVMEIWPGNSRGMLAGLIGAASNVGFLTIALVGLSLSVFLADIKSMLEAMNLSPDTVNWLVRNSGWRILLMFGAAPALLTFFIRIFVPESSRWEEERKTGATSNWATQDLLGVLVGALGASLIIPVFLAPNLFSWARDWDWKIQLPLTLVCFAVSLGGFTYPVLRYLQRSESVHTDARHAVRPTLMRMLLAACLGGVALLGTWGAAQWLPTWADQLAHGAGNARAHTQIASALGAIVGTILGALVGDWIGRRITYALLCAGSLASSLALYQLVTEYNWMFLAASFVVGGITASFYGWLPLYLPELFRTGVRATGQGFSFNFGRILAAIGVLQTGYLISNVFKNDYPQALSVISMVYVIGMVIIWFAPETKGKPLPE